MRYPIAQKDLLSTVYKKLTIEYKLSIFIAKEGQPEKK